MKKDEKLYWLVYFGDCGHDDAHYLVVANSLKNAKRKLVETELLEECKGLVADNMENGELDQAPKDIVGYYMEEVSLDYLQGKEIPVKEGVIQLANNVFPLGNMEGWE